MLSHRADLDADFRVFYRTSLKQAEHQMSGPEFFALAYRVSAYQGVMAARLEAARDRQEGGDDRPVEVGLASPEVSDLFD